MVWDEPGSGGGSAKIVFLPRTSQLTRRFAIFRAGLREGRHLECYTPPPYSHRSITWYYGVLLCAVRVVQRSARRQHFSATLPDFAV